jgi:hypothetical protein
MSELLQNAIIVFAVLLAVAYLVVHFVRRKRKKDACETCQVRKVLEEGKRRPVP